MPNIQYNTVWLRKQGLSRGRISVKLLELGKAEHLYMFITTAMLIIGVLADSLWAQSVPLCMGCIVVGLAIDYLVTGLISRLLCANIDLDKVDCIYE